MTTEKLIILPCHSIWKGGDTKGVDSKEWFLAPFQIEGQDHLCFRDHIELCFRELAKSPEALLVISGGQTKAAAGPVSEAYSYYCLAQSLYSSKDHEYHELFSRVALEEYARDSFENTLFSICRYKQFKGVYPTDITVVGFQFKAERIVKQHLVHALQYPVSSIHYVGNKPTPQEGINYDDYFKDLQESEAKYAIKPFEADNYGRVDPLLSKRNSRNPFKNEHGYEKSTPELKGLMNAIATAYGNVSDESIRASISLPWVV